MTFEQAAILLLLVGMVAVFALDRFRMEVVALCGLAAGASLGLVPARDIFSGFASPAVVTVIEILLIVQVLGRTRLLDDVAARTVGLGLGGGGTLAALCLATAFISVLVNNIGALALMIPVAFSACRATGLDPRTAWMPLSFSALLGGMCSIIGTPANLIVSQQLETATGESFAFFDYAWAGVPAALAGIAAILLWTPRMLGSSSGDDEAPAARRIVTELTVTRGRRFDGAAVSAFPVGLHGARRGDARLFLARGTTPLAAGDRLFVEADMEAIERLAANGDLDWAGSGSVEAVVMPESTLVGSRVGTLAPLTSRGIRVAAVTTRSPRIEGGLADVQLSIGDILHLDGAPADIAEALTETGLLALAAARRAQEPVSSRLPLALFAGGVALAVFNIAAPEIALGLVVLALAAAGALNLRTGLAELDWPILIMLAAMIPLGLAVDGTGAAAVLAGALVAVLPGDSAFALFGAVLLLAVAITPFVNNASTAIVLGPIAIGIAQAAALPPQPLLIAVALGASIDFLTPFGHHNNTVVMGMGGYRFADYLRAGWPVTLAACAAALAAGWLFWL